MQLDEGTTVEDHAEKDGRVVVVRRTRYGRREAVMPMYHQLHRHYAGYVAERRHPWGHLVILDRERGGDWIDADDRWVVIAEFTTQQAQPLIGPSFTSQKKAWAFIADDARGHSGYVWLFADGREAETMPVPTA